MLPNAVLLLWIAFRPHYDANGERDLHYILLYKHRDRAGPLRQPY